MSIPPKAVTRPRTGYLRAKMVTVFILKLLNRAYVKDMQSQNFRFQIQTDMIIRLHHLLTTISTIVLQSKHTLCSSRHWKRMCCTCKGKVYNLIKTERRIYWNLKFRPLGSTTLYLHLSSFTLTLLFLLHSQMKRLLNWANLYSTCLFFLPTPLPEIFRWHMFWVEKTQDSPRCCYETHYDKSPLITDCFKSQLCVECQHNAGDNLWKWVLFSAHISNIASLTDVEKNHP